MLDTASVTGQAGDVAFTFRSDRLALDFAATLMFRSRGAGALELLRVPVDLMRWAVAAGVVDPAPGETDGDETLEAAVTLREAIYRSALATLDHRPLRAADVAVLNRTAASPAVDVRLARGSVRRSGSAAQVLSAIARDAIDLFGGPEAARLRQCGRDGCTRLFVDRSRGHSRVWCGMRECGNRVNAAAYRRRRGTAAG